MANVEMTCVCGIMVGPIRPRWGSFPRNSGTYSSATCPPADLTLILEGYRVGHDPNHSSRRHNQISPSTAWNPTLLYLLVFENATAWRLYFSRAAVLMEKMFFKSLIFHKKSHIFF